jgi:hypothetical protein
MPAPRPALTIPVRLLLLGVAAAVGVLAAFGWSLDASDVPYNFLLRPFLTPGFQVASLGVAVVLGFVVGLGHVFRI